MPLPVWAADTALDAVPDAIKNQACRKIVMRFDLESQLLELVWGRRRRKVAGIPAKNKISAATSMMKAVSTPTPNACLMSETYPNSSEQIPATLATGMLIAAIKIAV